MRNEHLATYGLESDFAIPLHNWEFKKINWENEYFKAKTSVYGMYVQSTIPIVSEIWSRIHRKKRNFLMVNLGQTGSGKSYTALYFAWLLDRNKNKDGTFSESRFTVDKVIFDPKKFVAKIRNNWKVGEFLVFDEIGVGANARKWYSAINMALSYIAQTFRFKRLGVIFTTPDLKYIDAQVRRLFHAGMRIFTHDDYFAYGRFYWLAMDPYQGELYRMRPRYKLNRRLYDVFNLAIRLPWKDREFKKLLDDYEAKKEAFMDNLYRKLEKELYEAEDKAEAEEKTSYEIAEEIWLNYEDYMIKMRGGVPQWDVGKIMIDYGLKQTKAREVANMLTALWRKHGGL